MSTRYPMPCKFTPAHGAFANGVALRLHYDEQHPEYRPADPESARRLVECSVCGAQIKRKSFSSHRKMLHAGRGDVVEIGRKPHKALASAVAPDAPPPAPKPSDGHVAPEPWSADDIVLPVIEQLAQPGGVVPVAYLSALFAWRDATATMLEAVLPQ